jgi:hypothetical protein
MWTRIQALLHIGGNIGVTECALAYLLPLFLYLYSPAQLVDIFSFNLKCQLALFFVVVQLPLAITGKMAYVDLG